MKLKFDSSQQYQLQAIAGLVDLFEGQPLNKGDFTITETMDLVGSQVQTELGIGNRLLLGEDRKSVV